VLGTVVSNALAWPVLLYAFLREFDLTPRWWLRGILWPNTPGFLLQVATAGPLLWLAERTDRLFAVGGLFLASVAMSLAMFLLLGLQREQRGVLFATLKAAMGVRPAT
jgi:hypothetical protein